MRAKERIEPLLSILWEMWKEREEMRLWQFIENCWIGWFTEDLNESIEKMCAFNQKPFYKYVLWGTRGKDGKSPLKYKRMYELETAHLEELLKLSYCQYKEEALAIINERKEKYGKEKS